MQPRTRKSKRDYLPNGQPAHSTAAARPVRKRGTDDKEQDRHDTAEEEQQE